MFFGSGVAIVLHPKEIFFEHQMLLDGGSDAGEFATQPRIVDVYLGKYLDHLSCSARLDSNAPRKLGGVEGGG